MRRYIKEMLDAYTARSLSLWHMPGHKRKPVLGGMWDRIFPMDLTEVPGTDDLHHAQGAILYSEAAAADAVGAAYCHYLVGGSTAGIMAAVMAATEIWKRRHADGLRPVFLVGSHCHISVKHGLTLAGAETVALQTEEDPFYGPVSAMELLRVLSEEVEDPERIAGCIITSPTYSGSLSKLGELHAALEVYGIPLIVDEAHGAHLPFSEELSGYSGINCGAEYVVASLHKTLPALTQTAVLYVGGEHGLPMDPNEDYFVGWIDSRGKVKTESEISVAYWLSVYQSSSPSYILMMSAEEAIAWADENRDRMNAYIQRMKDFRNELSDMLGVLRIRTFAEEQDPTRLMFVISPDFLSEWQAKIVELESAMEKQKGGSRIFRRELYPKYHAVFSEFESGTRLAAWLEREEGVVAELAGSRELIFISTVCDEEEDLQRLKGALLRLDREMLRQKQAEIKKMDKKIRKLRLEMEAKTGEEKAAESGTERELSEISETSSALPDMDLHSEVLSGGEGRDRENLPKVGDFVQRDIYVYPPGVPIIRAGERVTEKALQKLEEEQAAGRRIYGL